MSSLENLLDIDLNEVVSKAVNDKMRELEREVSELKKGRNENVATIAGLKKKVSEAEDILAMSETVKNRYASIKGTDNEQADSKRFEMIAGFMDLAFGEKPAYGHQHDSPMWANLAVNFHHCRESLCIAVKAIMAEGGYTTASQIIGNVSAFKMPWDYPKDVILKFVRETPYNTNGVMTGIIRYWLAKGCGYNNVPYDLILKSPFFKDDDVFKEVLAAIKSERAQSDLLFMLPNVNELSDDQIKEMGRLVVGKTIHGDSEMAKFVKKHLHRFDEPTIENLCKRSVDGYGWKLLNYQWFPVKYQKQFLMAKEFKEILHIFSQSGCEWTVDQKREFLSEYLNPTALPKKA